MNYDEKKAMIEDVCCKILRHKVAITAALKNNEPPEVQKKLIDEFLKIQEPVFAMYVNEINKVINPVNPIILPMILAVFTSVTKMLETQCTEEDRQLSVAMQKSIVTVAAKFNPEDFRK